MSDVGTRPDDRDRGDREAILAQRDALLAAVNDPESALRQLEALQTWLAENPSARENPSGPGGEIEITGNDTAIVAKELVCLTQDLDRVEAVLGAIGTSIVEPVESEARLGVSRVPFSTGGSTIEVIRACVENGLSVGPNGVTMQASWRMKGLGWPELPTRELGDRPQSDAGKGVTVAVIDGGFAPQQPSRTDGWLDGIWGPAGGDEALDTDPIPGLDVGAGHGTFVSGIIRQVAPACSIRQYRALNSAGFGSQWRLTQAILAAIDDGCSVINLSAGSDPGDLPSPALSACLHMAPDGVLVVGAAGNAGSGEPTLPASHHRTICVGALDADLTPAPWSNHGPWVDFSCVGEGIVSTFVEGTEPNPTDAPVQLNQTTFVGPNPIALWAGTSFAAPQVSGWLATALARLHDPQAAVKELRWRSRVQTTLAHPEMGFRVRIL